jgi:hypothetical protein
MKHLIDHAHTGITTILHDDGERLAIERVADVEPVLNEIADIKKSTGGMSSTSELAHVGRIPAIVIEQYCNEHGIDFYTFMNEDVHVTRLLTDSNYSKLRIWEGAL